MAKVKFRTALSALKKGGKACYQCVPVLENKVTVKWTQDGEEKSLEITPRATTPTRMDFYALYAFDDIPDNTELTFEFELSGESVEGRTPVIGA